MLQRAGVRRCEIHLLTCKRMVFMSDNTTFTHNTQYFRFIGGFGGWLVGMYGSNDNNPMRVFVFLRETVQRPGGKKGNRKKPFQYLFTLDHTTPQ